MNDLVASSFPVSAKLGLAAFLLAVVLGVSAGVIAALNQNTKWDYTVMGFAMTGVVIPSFVVAPLLVLIFAITLKWLPGAGTAARLNSSSCRWWRCRWPISPASPVSRVAR